MKSVGILQRCALLVATSAAPNGAAESRGPTSIDQVAAACDGTEEALQNLKLVSRWARFTASMNTAGSNSFLACGTSRAHEIR